MYRDYFDLGYVYQNFGWARNPTNHLNKFTEYYARSENRRGNYITNGKEFVVSSNPYCDCSMLRIFARIEYPSEVELFDSIYLVLSSSHGIFETVLRPILPHRCYWGVPSWNHYWDSDERRYEIEPPLEIIVTVITSENF